MAQEDRTTLKSYFETGDSPTQDQFIDLIDSLYNLSDDGTVALQTDKYVFMKPPNTTEDSDGNWRMYIDSGTGNLVTEKRKSGAWVKQSEQPF